MCRLTSIREDQEIDTKINDTDLFLKVETKNNDEEERGGQRASNEGEGGEEFSWDINDDDGFVDSEVEILVEEFDSDEGGDADGESSDDSDELVDSFSEALENLQIFDRR